jgi:hypothetical protein
LQRVFLTKLHLYLNLTACVLVGGAGTVVYLTKREADEKHFRTPHAWAALVTSMFFLLNIFQVRGFWQCRCRWCSERGPMDWTFVSGRACC